MVPGQNKTAIKWKENGATSDTWESELQSRHASKGVIFIGPIFQGGARGVVCRNLVTLLAALKMPLRVIDSDEGGIRFPVSRDFQILLNDLPERSAGTAATMIVYGSPAELGLFARYDHLRPARRIACLALEHGADLSAAEPAQVIGHLDEIWVTAHEQARQIIAAGYPGEKVRVVDAYLRPRDVMWRHPVPSFNFGPWVKEFRFLCFLDESTPLKPILRSWFRSFSYSDEAALVLTSQPFRGAGALPRDLKLEMQKLLREVDHAEGRRAQVVVIDRVLTEEDWIRLYVDCDALVAAPRAYGHPGLEILEMAALGKPVIGCTPESVEILNGSQIPLLPQEDAQGWRKLWQDDGRAAAATALLPRVRSDWSNRSAEAALAQALRVPEPTRAQGEAATDAPEAGGTKTNPPVQDLIVRPFVHIRSTTPGVTLIGPVFHGTAQAAEDRFLLRALQATGAPVELRMTDDDPQIKRTSSPEFVKEMEQLSREPVGAHGGVHLQNRVPYHLDRFRLDRWQIGRTWLDVPQIPEEWLKRTELLDEIWVPGPFSRQSFVAGGVAEERLKVVPGGVDSSIFRPGAQPLALPGLRAFNFLAVSEWYLRDGYNVLLEAYLREFTREDDVSLIVSVMARRGQPNVLAEIWRMIERRIGKSVEDAPSVLLVDHLPLPEERVRLYATAQCFVYPHRCAAYGEACMEAAASGLPVLAIRHGAPQEIFTDDTAWWIDVERMAPTPPDLDEENLHGQQWAEPSVDHLRAQMRRALTDQQALATMSQAARAHMIASRDFSVTLGEVTRRMLAKV